MYALFCQQILFLLYLFPCPLPIKTTNCAIMSYNPMTRHIGSKGIAPQSLPHRLSTATAYTARQLTIGDSFTTRYIQQFDVYTSLEICDACSIEHPFPYIIVNRVHLL